MSEYQHYAFRAIDNALSEEQMRRLRALSSRATITPFSFENTYDWGNFRGNPNELMEEYFDAHTYVSNFGAYTLMLRLPIDAQPVDDLRPYAGSDALGFWTTDTHVILAWQVEEEYGGDWIDGEGWIDRLVPIRDELVRGDYRSLYIGWLRAVHAGIAEDRLDDDIGEEGLDEENEASSGEFFEPSVPAGLGSLTAAQSALIEFLQIDLDLVRAAASCSPDLPVPARALAPIAEWVDRLPIEEVRAALVRLIADDGNEVRMELKSRYHRFQAQFATNATNDASADGPRPAYLLAYAQQIKEERKRRQAEEHDRARRQRLEATIERAVDLWVAADRAAALRTPKGYDQACKLVRDLRDAYDFADRRDEFDDRVAWLRARYSGRPAFLQKLQAAAAPRA